MKNETTSTGNLSKRKQNGYNSSVLRAKRKARQFAADDRLAAWKDLTPTEQLNSLKGRRGESKRQVARIQTLLKK
jgi:hypothetical protein